MSMDRLLLYEKNKQGAGGYWGRMEYPNPLLNWHCAVLESIRSLLSNEGSIPEMIEKFGKHLVIISR